MHAAASVVLLALVLALPEFKRRLGGPAGALLGRLSFPIYLLHLPVICFVGAGLYSLLAPDMSEMAALIASCLASAIVTVLLAVPLMAFETRWLAKLGNAVDRAMPYWSKQPT
jgi:peptidoglycan/LPS O-acetylase OafA/YrhL